MRALITGATGFIGRALVRAMTGPVVLTRDPDRAGRVLGPAVALYRWDPQAGPPPAEAFSNVDAIFHLAGQSIADSRWSEARKRLIRDSRVIGTRNLVARIESLRERPRVLISASAVGFYGDRGDEALEEPAAPGKDFLAELCRDWEAEAQRATTFGVRVVTPRTGIVLGRSGGALAKMLPPFKLGLGGRLGSGRQWMPWIHLHDHVGLLFHAAARPEVSGALNAVGPAPVTNAEFTRTLALVLRRPAIFPVPAFMLRLVFGELSSVLLSSQRVVPRVAEKTGYQFRFSTLEAALRDILGEERAAQGA